MDFITLFAGADCPFCFHQLNYYFGYGREYFYCSNCKNCKVIQHFNKYWEIKLIKTDPYICTFYYYNDLNTACILDEEYNKLPFHFEVKCNPSLVNLLDIFKKCEFI